ncbi:Ankyrin_repeat protein 1 [Hexamita inflata]|uniref:Ankyrin repeat protein 1 n=1 Tax=Hexamita inflata TaxID=28002 RepID=A0AA86NPV0_9EUKA|nr:Ankyrin repeat protein 1 [Hexamita inflata]
MPQYCSFENKPNQENLTLIRKIYQLNIIFIIFISKIIIYQILHFLRAREPKTKPNFDQYFDQKLLNENVSRFRTSHLEILSQNEANDLFLFSAGNNNVALALFLVINYKFEQSGVSPLMIAAQNNNAELVKIFKQQNGRKDVYGTTALMYAVLNDADAAVQELAKYELHEVNNQNMTARDIALALHADQSIVQILECAQC